MKIRINFINVIEADYNDSINFQATSRRKIRANEQNS